MEHAHLAVVADTPDHDGIQIPLAKNVNDLALAAGVRHDQHALLGFGEQHFISRHTRFALWHQS